MYGGTVKIEFDVQLKTKTRGDFIDAIAMIEERMFRVVDHADIRKPIHPLTHRHGVQLAEVIQVKRHTEVA
jgi:hypothetical protein